MLRGNASFIRLSWGYLCEVHSQWSWWCEQAHQEGGGGGGRGYSTGPTNLFRDKGPHELEAFKLKFLPFWAASFCYFFFFLFPLHCLDSMSEDLGRIISNTFSKRGIV